MGSFADGPGAARSGDQGVTPMHNDLSRLANELWWTGKIPYRNLSWRWNFGKWRPLLSTPTPLRS
jgi:hypothetical protein